MTEGLVRGEGFAIDASVIKADTNRARGIPGAEVIDWRQSSTCSRAVREYLDAVEENNPTVEDSPAACLSPGVLHHYGPGARRPIWLPHNLSGPQCLLSSVSVGKNVLGSIYADRASTSREIDEPVLQGFRVFSRHLDMACLSVARSKV